jgi:hypothetical protein
MFIVLRLADFEPGKCCRYLLKLQMDEIQIHAEELSSLRRELEDERSERLQLQVHIELEGGDPGPMLRFLKYFR